MCASIPVLGKTELIGNTNKTDDNVRAILHGIMP
jgi:hypothetical protein